MPRETLSGRIILITGGTGGVGMAAARRFLELGAHVVLGSRDPSRYEEAASRLGSSRVSSFIVDVTDRDQVEAELELLKSRRHEPTDVVHCAAGGMEPLMLELTRLMRGLRQVHGADLDAAHAVARQQLAALVDTTREQAMTVNQVGPSFLLERLARGLPAGGTVTFYSSLWASLYPHPQVPVYYEAVAAGKQALERWLERQAAAWGARDITTLIISANLILDTRMGYILDRFCTDLMTPAERDEWRSAYVSCTELVDATAGILERTALKPNSGGLVRLYLPGGGMVTDRLGPGEWPMLYRLALAANAPSWADQSLSAAT